MADQLERREREAAHISREKLDRKGPPAGKAGRMTLVRLKYDGSYPKSGTGIDAGRLASRACLASCANTTQEELYVAECELW